MLELNQVSKSFGGLKAVEEVTIKLHQGEIVGLIGPNGSGKTTLFNLITRTLPLTSGTIYFCNTLLNKLSPSEVCHLGISRTHQIPRPFRTLTTMENIILAYIYGRQGDHHYDDAVEETERLLSLVGLKEYRDSLASELNDVQCKVLELARSLATGPKLILLDEILAGLNPTELIRFQELIRQIREEMEITVFWCEHIMRALMTTVDRVICLDHGHLVCIGTPEEVANNPKVIECYLGKSIGS